MAAGDTDLLGVVPARQRRSREAVARILAATEGLLEHRPFGELTVQDICEAAEVSPSTFYARFPAREDVLLALFDLHQREARDAAEASILEVAKVSGDTDELLSAMLTHYLRFVRRNGPVMVSIFREPTLVDRYYALGGEVSDRLLDLLVASYGVDNREFRHRAEFAVRVCAAAARRATGLPLRFGERMGMSDDELVRELTAMASGYLAEAAAAARGSVGGGGSDR
jgi:AcrR family transcriptional regulator